MGSSSDFFELDQPETIQKWERELHYEIAMRTPFMAKKYGFIGDKPTFLCQKRSEVWRDGGTQATVTLRRPLRGAPAFGNQTLRGTETSPPTATFKWQINQVRKATQILGRITKKRVTWNVWNESLDALGTYFAQVTESAAMLHGAGVTVDLRTEHEWYHDGSNLGFTLSNAPRIPDTKHILRIGHTSDTDDTNVGADPAATLDLDTFSELKARAKTLPIPIRPAMVHGKELYVFFAHTYALRHMKEDSKWLAFMKATIEGGAINGNPVWSGALGIWDGVLIVEDFYVPPGISATSTRVANARRNIFCGAQSFVLGVAKEYDKDNMWQNETESWDYANNKGVAAHSLLGLKCPFYEVEEQDTTDDYGKLVCVSYAQELNTSL